MLLNYNADNICKIFRRPNFVMSLKPFLELNTKHNYIDTGNTIIQFIRSAARNRQKTGNSIY